MEKNLPKTNKQKTVGLEFNPSDVESAVRTYQLRILKRSAHVPDDGRVSIRFVREFEWSSNWAETLAAAIENDSRYFPHPGFLLPRHHDPESLQVLFQTEDSLASLASSQLSLDEYAGVVDRLRHFRISDLDDALLDAMYEACNWVVVEAITEANCRQELENAQDAVQRAELYMMMGNDVEAYREFKKVTPEESQNPDNTLSLVDLVERYDSAKSAIKLLRRWFLLEIVLHSLPFDLVSDLLSDRKKLEPSPRIRYLQSILIHSKTMSDDELQQHLMLVLPLASSIRPELNEVDRRLNLFGVSMKSMDLMLDENEPINLFSLMAGITEQLLHFADLARSAQNLKLAVKALERAVLSCFVILHIPEPDADTLSFSDDTDYMITSRVIIDYLDDMEEMLEDMMISFDPDIQHHFLSNQIAALRELIRRPPPDVF